MSGKILFLLGSLFWVPTQSLTLLPDTASYKFSADIGKVLRGNQPGANQFAAWDYSYIGQYQAALQAWAGPEQSLQPISAADSLAFTALKPVDARQYIGQRARNERIIIINEAHHNPRHRVFTASLLPALARLGYRYLAAEGLNEQDSLLNQRAYPVLATGFYTKEPQFGNLLRTAAQNGFRMVPYDYGFSHEGDFDSRVPAREMGQARNIARILQVDPQAKIIVHCGFSHANEGPRGMGKHKAMAAHLKALTGIDPFTIDQTVLTESGTRGGEDARYRLGKAPVSSVFLTAGHKPTALVSNDVSVDAMVYHPRTTYRGGRPDWVFSPGRRPVAVTRPASVGYPCLILAYAAAEDLTRAVPVDVVELQSPQDQKALALPRGNYTVVAKDHTGNTRTWTVKN